MSIYRKRVRRLESQRNMGKLSYNNTFILAFTSWQPQSEIDRHEGLDVDEKGNVTMYYLMKNVQGNPKGERVRDLTFTEKKLYDLKKLKL